MAVEVNRAQPVVIIVNIAVPGVVDQVVVGQLVNATNSIDERKL